MQDIKEIKMIIELMLELMGIYYSSEYYFIPMCGETFDDEIRNSCAQKCIDFGNCWTKHKICKIMNEGGSQ